MSAFKKILFLIIPALAAVLAGCGPAELGRRPPALSKDSFPNSPTQLDPVRLEQVENEFVCPAEANVLPHFDEEMDGSGKYKACYHVSSLNDLLFHGETSENEKLNDVCIFPVQYVDADNILLKPDIEKKSFAYERIHVSKDGFKMHFKVSDFNAVMIVEFHYLNKMLLCINDKTKPCPPFSFGKFK